MKTHIVLLVLATFFMASCKDTTITSGDKVGNLEGQVDFLYDGNNAKLSDRSGVRVSAEGTSFSGITDTAGYWKIKDLPEGTYSISFSKPGFDTYKNTSFQFVGGGTLWFGRIAMGQPPAYTVTIDSIQEKNHLANGRIVDSGYTVDRYDTIKIFTDSNVYTGRDSIVYAGRDSIHRFVTIYDTHVAPTLYGHFSQAKANCVFIIGTDPTLSVFDKNSYITTLNAGIDPSYSNNTSNGPNSFKIDIDNFPIGGKIYVRGYPQYYYDGSAYFQGSYYFDVTTHKNVLLGYGQSSNIVSFNN